MSYFDWKRAQRAGRSVLVCASAIAVASATVAIGQPHQPYGDHDGGHQKVFIPGNLVVSRSVYDNNAANVTVGEQLPPQCVSTGADPCVTATNNGTFPGVFNNALADGSFGVTSRIYLDQLTPFGYRINSLEVPNSLQRGITIDSDQLVTSFSSKSELALNLSTSGKYLTFMDYVAPVNSIDASNSNTPAVIDPTNSVGIEDYRAVATVDPSGRFRFTETNAYSGNNGRAAILNDSKGADVFYMAGNAGNGGKSEPVGVILGAGAQLLTPANAPEAEQTPGLPTPLASFSVTQLGDKADKIGKDDNFRGLAVYNNVVYYTKGSGSNGVNTVYFVDTTGKACPNGTGLPATDATLPTQPLSYSAGSVENDGLPNNMCILAGFPTTSNKDVNPTHYPFGIWFANADTLYVADEGDGFASDNTLYTHAAAQTNAGLEKWVFNPQTQQWQLAYVLQSGLDLGQPYTVAGYPAGNNAATGLPWAPATDGLRNITGHVNPDGTVTIYAITSTVSGGGDTGADPNKLVAITDVVRNTNSKLAAWEHFHVVERAGFAEVLRGVSFTPGTVTAQQHGFGDGRW